MFKRKKPIITPPPPIHYGMSYMDGMTLCNKELLDTKAVMMTLAPGETVLSIIHKSVYTVTKDVSKVTCEVCRKNFMEK